MPARILDGKRIGDQIREEVARGVARFRDRAGVVPGLAAILVGDDPASEVYVRNKRQATEAAGMRGFLARLPSDASEAQLLAEVDRANDDPNVHGILVQLPLPRHIDDRRVIERVDPAKDVDGFHPENVGLLAIGRPRFVPCTPLGVQAMLVASGIETRGLHAVVLGRSNIVGKPMAMLLMQKGPGGGRHGHGRAHRDARRPRGRAIGRPPDRRDGPVRGGSGRLDQARRGRHRRGHPPKGRRQACVATCGSTRPAKPPRGSPRSPAAWGG